MADRSQFTLKTDLFPDTGNEPSALTYHLQNHGATERTWITGHDRDEVVTVTGELAEVVHGHTEDSGSKKCTLIVFNWWINGHNEGKRFKHVQIKATFKNEVKGAYYDPIVISLAPRGVYSMLQSNQPVDKNINARISAQTPSAFGSIGFTFSYGSTERQNFVKIVGSLQAEPNKKDGGIRPNVVQWDLDENASTKSGLPSYFRTAVLLERKDDSPFTAHFGIETKVDMFTDFTRKVKELAGLNPKDEPVIFNPAKASSSPTISPNNMKSWKENLLDLCTFTTPTGNVAQIG